jgi:hypothetical protein
MFARLRSIAARFSYSPDFICATSSGLGDPVSNSSSSASGRSAISVKETHLRIAILGGGVLPDVAEQEMAEARLALIAAEESNAEKKIFDALPVGARGIGGFAAGAFDGAVHGV